MPYATQDDIVDRYGEDMLFSLANRDGDDNLDNKAIEKALCDATDEMDSYLAVRYALPLEQIPTQLKRLCVDIALYRLSPDHGTEERRNRYEDAIAMLGKLASGKAILPGMQASSSGSQPDLAQKTEMSVSTAHRIFTHGFFERM